MHAYLIVGDEGSTQREAAKLVDSLGAKKIPFEVSKIDDVRALSRMTRLALNEKTAVIIENFDQVTEVTQNSFLKALEEPQENLYYVLTSQTKASLLPTILSRCQIIEVGDSKKASRDQTELTENFLELSVGERLQKISKIKARDEALEFVEDLIRGGHGMLAKDLSVAGFLEKAIKARFALKSNGNVGLQLTNFVVSLDS